jgi:glycosyltransferase involved in cell wall biosynthesis
MKISIVIPALNEEKNLEAAVKGLAPLLEKEESLKDYEILIFDDGSTDKTGEIADRLSQENNRIKVIHNPRNMGLGYNFRKGAELATGNYVSWFPSDNENTPESFISTLKHAGEADVIIAYTSNMEVRPLKRRILSRIYTFINNLIFGLHLRYFNGLSVYRRDLLLKIPPWSNSFAYAVEILVPLLKSGASYIEVPVEIRPTTKTSALKLKRILQVFKAIFLLFWRINIKRGRIQI